MNKSILLLGTLGLSWGLVQAEEESTSPHKFAFNVAATTDYAFRGVSQSQEDPAIQGGVTYTHESGFYLGAWASSIDFTPDDAQYDDGADVELDTFLGYGWNFNENWKGDVQFIRYNYPGTKEGYDYDYNEIIGKVTWYENYTAMIGYSNDVFNTDETGIYYNFSANWKLPKEFVLNTGIGYYDLDNPYDSYVDATIGVKRSFGPLSLSLAYVTTNNDGEKVFGDLAGDRLIFTASADF